MTTFVAAVDRPKTDEPTKTLRSFRKVVQLLRVRSGFSSLIISIAIRAAVLLPVMVTTGPTSRVTSPSASGYVCPLCGTTFDDDRQSCTNCGGNLVVLIDDGSVYETILPMCGCHCDVASVGATERW